MPDADPRPLWSKTPVALISGETTAAEYTVYGWLDFKAGRRGWWCCTQQQIADANGLKLRAVNKAVQRLRTRGFIETRRAGRVNGEIRYLITARTTAHGNAQQSLMPDTRESTQPIGSVTRESTQRLRASARIPRARTSGSGSRSRSGSGPSDLPTDQDPESTSTGNRDPYGHVVRRSWP